MDVMFPAPSRVAKSQRNKFKMFQMMVEVHSPTCNKHFMTVIIKS